MWNYLDSDNGRILWRHKFEEEPGTGSVGALAVLGKHVVSVSGSTDLFLRLWDPLKGALVQVTQDTQYDTFK